MKTKEELNALKSEVEALNKKLAELTEEELEQVSGGLTDNALLTFNGMYLNNGARTAKGVDTKNLLYTEAVLPPLRERHDKPMGPVDTDNVTES